MCILRFLQGRQRYRSVRLRLPGGTARALVADTAIKRMIGLMYRQSLEGDTVMLFVFPREGRHGIWMRNMRFSIDVLWLDSRMRIVDIRKGLNPCRSMARCRTYYPKADAAYVVEGIAGFAAQHSLVVGAALAKNR